MRPTPSLTEPEAVARFLEDPSSENYGALYRAVMPQVLAFFRARDCAPEIAEDLAQDVMLTLYRQSAQLRDRNLFRPWLFRIARNALLRYRQKNRNQAEAMEPTQLDTIAAETSDPLATPQFLQWMRALNDAEREVVILKYVQGSEYHEIATLLEMPAGTVQWRVFQSIKKLAARFGGRR